MHARRQHSTTAVCSTSKSCGWVHFYCDLSRRKTFNINKRVLVVHEGPVIHMIFDTCKTKVHVLVYVFGQVFVLGFVYRHFLC